MSESAVAERVAIDVQTLEGIGYDLVHNGRPFITSLQLRAIGARPEHDVRVRVVLGEGDTVIAGPWEREFPTVTAAGLALEPDLSLDPVFMRSVEEQRPVELRIDVHSGDKELGSHSERLALFAHNQWMMVVDGGQLGSLSMALLSAHVQPNDPVVADVLADARGILRKKTGSASTEGYQAGRQRAAEISQSVYEAIVGRGFDYSNPPASWDLPGQKIRTHQQVLKERAATCLDSAVLYAACLEAAGLKPQLWLPPGHALVGVWLDEDELPHPAMTDPKLTSLALNLVDARRILLVETTVMARGMPFSGALKEGWDAVNGDVRPVMGVVDIGSARLHGFTPLPATRKADDGTVEVHTYRAGEIRVEKVLPQGGLAARESDVPLKVRMWKNALLDLSLRNQLINFRPGTSSVELLVPPSDDKLHPLDFIEDELHVGAGFVLDTGEGVEHIQGHRGAGAAVGGRNREFLTNLLVAQRRVFARVDPDRYAPRLRRLRYASRSSVQETGTNNLFLTLGSLVWTLEGRELKSPLILAPVTLEGGARGTPFRMSLDESGASTPNYTLIEKLKAEFGLELPHLENPLEDSYGIAVEDIFQQVREAVIAADLPFRIDETAHLSVLQFAKFRLWKDLDDHWERFLTNPLVKHLTESRTEYFEDRPSQGRLAMSLDDLGAMCPVPADASQLEAIKSAVEGETFVLEGPPGTGKSQTITNLLARAIAEGRKVLFVAEKRAALDVVQSRLAAIGLDPFCLDMHDKGSKPAAVRRQLLDSLTYEPSRDPAGVEAAQGQARASSTILARYRDRLHAPNAIGYSLYSAHERILAMRQDDPYIKSVGVTPDEVAALSEEAWRSIRPRLLDIGQTIDDANSELNGPWVLAGPVDFDRLDRAALERNVRDLISSLDRARSGAAGSASLQVALAGVDLTSVRQLVSNNPPPLAVLDQMADPGWSRAAGQRIQELRAAAADPALEGVSPVMWTLPIESIQAQAIAADSSGMFGRKKQRQAVADQIRPGLFPGHPEPPLKQLGVWVTALHQAKQRSQAALSGLSSLPGLSDAGGINPWDSQAVESLAHRVATCEWMASVVTADSPVRPVLREVAADSHHSMAEVEAAEEFAHQWGLLRSTLAVEADALAIWQSDRTLDQAIDASREAWLADSSDQRFRRLAVWLDAARALNELHQAGLSAAISDLREGRCDPLQLEQSVTLGVLEASLTERAAAGRLDAFQPDAHERSVERFIRSTTTLRERMAEEIPADLIRNRPFDASSLVGEVGSLQRELFKERRGLSIRALISRYGSIIRELTPCFLTSPDSAARFLEPGAIDFDLVVFDEASQIRVAEAIGAMGRGKAVVVVGDSRQMPPTTFGAAFGESDEELDDVEVEAADEESILSECVQARVQRRWLTWHYRSRDEALIAFSNSKYYDGRLASFPAPQRDRESASVSHTLVPDGYFFRTGDRRQLRTNPREARAVVDDVVRRFRVDPTASVGVVTFNIQQRDLILTLLSTCDEPAVVASLEADDEDSLFVKNLENVQGDERDAIVFSIAFSKNDKGILPLNFGPMNRSGGERRLNVAVTRARREVKVFSSFLPSDMRVDASESTGLRHLHDYLEMAVRGAHDVAEKLGRSPTAEDRHREAVAHALRQRGWPVRSDVGLSSFRIDLVVGRRDGGVGDLAAILLDGPGWAQRPSVGDRDGLPVEVLAGMLGWPVVSRVWLPTWLEDPDAVVALIETELAEASMGATGLGVRATIGTDAIEQAAPAPQAWSGFTTSAQTAPAAESALSEFERAVLNDHPVSVDEVPRTMRNDLVHRDDDERPFRAWDRPYLQPWLLDEPTASNLDRIRSAMAAGADAEGPIHAERLVRLVADALGIRRLSAEKQRTLMSLLPRSRATTENGTVMWPAGIDPASYLEYRPSSSSDRSLSHVPAIEVGNAMIPIVRRSMGVDREELFRETMRVFGSERLTAQVRSRMQAGLENALDRGLVVEAEDRVLPG